MVSTRTLRHLAFALAAAHSAMAQNKVYVGCYSSNSGLTEANKDPYQTEDICVKYCVEQKGGAAVIGLANKDTCLCGNQAPPNAQKVKDELCTYGCNGYGLHPCGGPGGLFTVYLTGTQASVQAVGGGTVSANGAAAPVMSDSSSVTSSGTSTSATPSVATTVVAPGQTVTTTAAVQAPSQTTAAQAGSSSVNVGAVAGGVVVGLFVLFAIIGAVFFIRRRKRRAAEEAHSTSAANFVAGGPARQPGMSGPRGPDSRFDAEAMAHRRLSDGSIADNEDYSRRILKVTNA